MLGIYLASVQSRQTGCVRNQDNEEVPLPEYVLTCFRATRDFKRHSHPQTASKSANEANKLHDYLQQAATAMHQGARTDRANSSPPLDPRSMAALNKLGIVLVCEGKRVDAILLYDPPSTRVQTEYAI